MIGLFQEPGKKATVFVAQQKKNKKQNKKQESRFTRRTDLLNDKKLDRTP